MRRSRSLCLLLIGAISVTMAAAAELTTDSLAEIKKNVDEEKAVLVDVRERREWDRGHVEGAIFLPLSVLQDGVTEEELESLPKKKIIYTHCVVGKRAVTAGSILKRYGYKVRPIKPGYKELIAAGFPKAEE